MCSYSLDYLNHLRQKLKAGRASVQQHRHLDHDGYWRSEAERLRKSRDDEKDVSNALTFENDNLRSQIDNLVAQLDDLNSRPTGSTVNISRKRQPIDNGQRVVKKAKIGGISKLTLSSFALDHDALSHDPPGQYASSA